MKLSTEVLHSGKFQVKFEFTGGKMCGHYGYILIESDATTEKIILLIEERLLEIRNKKNFGISRYNNIASPLYL